MAEGGGPAGTRTLVKAAPVVGAGALTGLAVEFHALGWSSIPGNSCGSRYRPCPEGTTPTLVLAFLLTFVGLPVLVATVAAFTRVRPGKAVPGALAAAGALIVLWPGWQASLWMRGPVLDRAWRAGPDRPASVRGVGVWAVGDSDGDSYPPALAVSPQSPPAPAGRSCPPRPRRRARRRRGGPSAPCTASGVRR